MRFDRNILSITFLVAALAYTLWFVFAGFGNHQDPLYWLYKYEHLEGGWMAVGTLLTGGAVVRLFGAQLLPLRLFGWLCTVAAIALPYVCLLTKEQRRSNLHWLALTYVLMGYGAFQEFSPGTLSVLLLAAIWVTVCKDRENPSSLGLWGTALLAGTAVAVRFPNILVFLVLIPLWKKRSLKAVPIAALAAGVVYLLGYVLVTPAAADAAMNSHDLWSMVEKLWTNSGRLLGYMLLSAGVLYLPWRTKPFVGWGVGGAIAMFVLYAMKPLQWYNLDLTYLIAAFCLVIALVTQQRTYVTGVLVMMVAALGTDTAWLKLFPALLCILPVALSHCPDMPVRRYLYEVLTVLCTVVVVRMTTNSVGQSNLMRATTWASVSPYKGIAIREAEQERLIQYKADYDSLMNAQTANDQTVNVLALGQEAHLMRAVTGCEAARYNEFWSNIFDSLYTAKYREIIEAERPVVFCSFTPQFKTKPAYTDGASRMEQMLIEEGYTALSRKEHKYIIYIPDTDD